MDCRELENERRIRRKGKRVIDMNGVRIQSGRGIDVKNTQWIMFVPHRKHITSPYEPNRLMRSIGLWRWYTNITVAILDFIHCLACYLNTRWIILVPHRRHITSPLQAQQVNAIYRFVTMVYQLK
jgi:hypothetical protein